MGIQTGASSNSFNLPGGSSQYILSEEAQWHSKSENQTAAHAIDEAWANYQTVKICVGQMGPHLTPGVLKKIQGNLAAIGRQIFGFEFSKIEKDPNYTSLNVCGLKDMLDDLIVLDQDLSRNEQRCDEIVADQWNHPIIHREERLYGDLQPGEFRIELHERNKKPYRDRRDDELDKLRPRIQRHTNGLLEYRSKYNEAVYGVQHKSAKLSKQFQHVEFLSEFVRAKLAPRVSGQTSAPANVNNNLAAPAKKVESSSAPAQPVPVSVEYKTVIGESLAVCGSGGGLSWDPAQAKPLSWQPGHKWTGSIPADAKEYKIVLIKSGAVKWEQASNHSVKDATPQVIAGITFK